MSKNNSNNPHTMLIPIGALGAGLTKTVVGPKMLRDAVIKSVQLVDSVGIPADAVNYAQAILHDHTNNIDLAKGSTRALDPLHPDYAGALTAYEGLEIPLIGSVGDAHQGGANAEGPGVTDTMADKGATLSVIVSSPGTAVLTAATLSVTYHYL